MNKSKLTNNIFLLIIFSLFFSHIVAIGYSNEVGVTDGMYVKYFYTSDMEPVGFPTTLTISRVSDAVYHVGWRWEYPSHAGTGNWDVTLSTNIVSNRDGHAPHDGFHNWAWIYSDSSLDDHITLYSFSTQRQIGYGDVVYTISDEYNITIGTMNETMEVWELTDAHGSVLWYEKSKGFFVNGTSQNLPYWEKFVFIETNAFPKAEEEVEEGLIPGYNYFFLIGLLLVSAIVILKNKSIRE